MKKVIFSFFISVLIFNHTSGQSSVSDSASVVTILKELLNICAKVDFGDPKVQTLGTFYKAAPYIVYQGENEQRKWKDIADYTKPEDKKGVDEVCYRINNTVNQDSSYQIIKYATERESEGTWHVLIVSYIRKGQPKKSAFAFLKIRNRFALGDID
jgi:hypothetical protein